ncbi:MAG TPA: M90 family metallopeptidase [Gemmatimonadaceae bacterium]|nr:M90 family metallopeptidase [Gemmatimonadaceae bacterium]
MITFFKSRRRERLRAQPLPDEWQRTIERNVPIVQRLPTADRQELFGHVQVFLAEKHFEGCGGLELTDEIRVTIAAQACLLLLHRETDYYPKLTSVLVYPSTYVVPGAHALGGGIWDSADETFLGHTQSNLSALVLAWDATLHGARSVDDGENLVLHEFAHQLDFESGDVNGTPPLESNRQYASWARVLGAEYDALRRASESGTPSVLDDYGAENPAEFFAVATEAFFERPLELRARHAALYEELRAFYRQDPAEWPRTGEG